ncbi:MAG: TolC family protein, partial [Gammaproteobacteria bacterium]|nr:TolC family protein [Gammaproteobacteria bacterium]
MLYLFATRAALIGLTACAAVALFGGCAGTYESAVRHDIDTVRARHDWPVDTSGSGTALSRTQADSLSTGVRAYVALALQNNPEIRAAFERWQASVHRISRARRLPEPTLGFGYFIQSVETRVGPQQARISLQQAFPWPTKLTAGADAASAQARSIQRRFEAQSLMIAQRVATAYWSLWQIRSTRSIHQQHLEVVRGLSESVRARISTGTAMLADLQQIDLTAARLEDNIRGMDEAERVAEAQLRAAIGVQGDLVVPTDQPPSDPASPSESREVLVAAAQDHPMITSLGFMAAAAESSARAEAADRYPSFTVGADWIITGDAVMPGVADSG